MYHKNSDKKYLYLSDNICHGGSSVCYGSKLHQRICTSSDGRYYLRSVFFRMYHRCSVVCDEDEDREKIRICKSWNIKKEKITKSK